MFAFKDLFAKKPENKPTSNNNSKQTLTHIKQIKAEITFIGHKNQKQQLTMNCVYGQPTTKAVGKKKNKKVNTKSWKFTI